MKLDHNGGNGDRGHYGSYLTSGRTHGGGGMRGNNGGGRGRGRGSERGRGGHGGNDRNNSGSYLKESMLQDPWEQLVQQHMIPQGLLHPSQSTVNFRPVVMTTNDDASAIYSSRYVVEEIPIDDDGDEDNGDPSSSSKRDEGEVDGVLHVGGPEG